MSNRQLSATSVYLYPEVLDGATTQRQLVSDRLRSRDAKPVPLLWLPKKNKARNAGTPNPIRLRNVQLIAMCRTSFAAAAEG